MTLWVLQVHEIDKLNVKIQYMKKKIYKPVRMSENVYTHFYLWYFTGLIKSLSGAMSSERETRLFLWENVVDLRNFFTGVLLELDRLCITYFYFMLACDSFSTLKICELIRDLCFKKCVFVFNFSKTLFNSSFFPCGFQKVFFTAVT